LQQSNWQSEQITDPQSPHFAIAILPQDETIDVMRRSLKAAKIGNTDKIDGLRRLDRFVQSVGRSNAPNANFGETVAREREISRCAVQPWAHHPQGHSVRLDNSLCIRRNPHNSHPKNGRVSAGHFVASVSRTKDLDPTIRMQLDEG
jgi:hypothetical protein